MPVCQQKGDNQESVQQCCLAVGEEILLIHCHLLNSSAMFFRIAVTLVSEE